MCSEKVRKYGDFWERCERRGADLASKIEKRAFCDFDCIGKWGVVRGFGCVFWSSESMILALLGLSVQDLADLAVMDKKRSRRNGNEITGEGS